MWTTENIDIMVVMNGHELFQSIDEKKIARTTFEIWTKLFFFHSEKSARETQTTKHFPQFFPKPTYTTYISIKSECYNIFDAPSSSLTDWLADGLVSSLLLLVFFFITLHHNFFGCTLFWWCFVVVLMANGNEYKCEK